MDNSKKFMKDISRYDALFQVCYSLQNMMKGMRKVWNTGKHINIDESIIKYMRRAVICSVHASNTN